jgi:integrase
MINRTGEVWIATLEQHKTAYRGKQRVLYFGPKSQMILRPYLLRGENDPCFSPAEAMSQRNAVRGENRSSPPNSGNRPGYSKRIREQRKAKRSPGKQYETGAYGKAIRYACEQVFPILEGTTAKEAKAHRIKHWWSPNQLLHLAAAQIRKEFGLDAAQVILGHSELTVTQVYAERDIEKGLTVAKAFG